MSEEPTASRELAETIASLAPVLQSGTFVFCSMFNTSGSQDAISVSRAIFVEDEGLSMIMPRTEAVRLGMIFDPTFRQIPLMVDSTLDSVGLTASVTSALAVKDISANVVTASQHAHLFVPSRDADRAVDALRELQQQAQAAFV